MVIPRRVAKIGVFCVQAAALLVPLFAVNADGPARLARPTGDDESSDRALRRTLEAAEDAIHSEDWSAAATLLDRVLTVERDAGITMLREDGGKERPVTALPHQEAERLLAGLPQKGRDAYQRQFGELAKGLLDEARKKNDAEQLRRIVRVYRYTTAGQETLLVLAGLHFHKNEVAQAAAAYGALLQQRIPSLWKAEQLLQAALAFRASGDSSNGALVSRELLARAGKADVEIGARKWSREELQKAFDKPEPAAIIADWPTQRAYPERNGRRIDVEPVLEPIWRQTLARTKETENWISTAEAALAKQNRPLLSGAMPVGIEVVTQSQAGSLVVFRSHWGLHAVDPYAGKLRWETPSQWSLDRMAQDAKKSQIIDNTAKAVLEKRPQVLFENSIFGTVSTDGVFVYLVEDFELPPGTVTEASPDGLRPKPMKWDFQISDAMNASKLLAFDLATGKLKWEVGGVTTKYEKPELPNSCFLGAPLLLDGKLYVAVETMREVQLAVLEPRTGKVLSVKPLFTHHEPIIGPRRLHTVQLVYGNGVLVCCANTGTVVGVDLLTQRLRWIVRYRDDLEKGTMVDKDSEWMPTPPVISGDKLILAAADSTAIHCLSLRDGQRIWSKPRDPKDMYLAGVLDGKVLVVGNGYIEAFWLDTGKKFWQVSMGTPSGFGAAAGHIYYLPLKSAIETKKPGLCVLDLKEREKTFLTGPSNEVPGNLLLFNGYVLSQTLQTLTVYPQAVTQLKTLDERLKKTPSDGEALRERGLLHRFRGELRSAAEDLRAPMKNTPNMQKRMEIRDQLFETLKELFYRDAGQLDQHWNEFKEVIGQEVDPTRTRVSGLGDAEWQRTIHFLMTVALALEKEKQYAAAAKYYVVIAEVTEDAHFLVLPQTPETEIFVRAWARTRLDEMRQSAPPEERKLIDEEIKKRKLVRLGSPDLRPRPLGSRFPLRRSRPLLRRRGGEHTTIQRARNALPPARPSGFMGWGPERWTSSS